MTRDEILALQPGRELDVLIHRLVLGRQCEHFTPTLGEFGSDLDGWYELQALGQERSILPVPVPRYSTDIGAAWAVVEAMRQRPGRRGHPCYSAHLDNKSDGGWTVQFAWPSLDDCHEARADTAPHAVCLAALLSVTQEKP